MVRADLSMPIGLLDTTVPGQKYPGTSASALAQSADGTHLFVADSSINAIAVFDTSRLFVGGRSSAAAPDRALGFIPTDWYPSALVTIGDNLLIATFKGQGTGPNNRPGELDWERTYHKPAHIAALLAGSVARLKIPETGTICSAAIPVLFALLRAALPSNM